MLTSLLLRRDCWKWFHMLGLHILFFFISYVCFSCSVGVFALQRDSGLHLLKLLWKGKRCVLSGTIHYKPVLINNSYILLHLVNFLFIFGAFYQILCKASVVQYRAFPRDPRKPFLLSSVLVRLKAGTVELFYLWMGSPSFLHTAKASATSHLPRVMTAQLCIWWWKADFVPSHFYLG